MKPENAPEQPAIATERILSTMDAELTRALLHKAGIMLVPQRMRDVAAVVAEAVTQMQRETTAPLAKKLFDTERVLNEAALALSFEQGRTLADVPKMVRELIEERDTHKRRVDVLEETVAALRSRDDSPNA